MKEVQFCVVDTKENCDFESSEITKGETEESGKQERELFATKVLRLWETKTKK